MNHQLVEQKERALVEEYAQKVTGNFIGGQWVASKSGSTLEIVDPSTGRTIGKVPDSTPEEVADAVQNAVAAQTVWAARTPSQRSKALLDLARLVEENFELFALLEAVDAGKPITAVRDDEMHGTLDAMRFFAGACRTLPTPASGDYLEGVSSVMRREPLGVIAAITPWNYPLLQAVAKVYAALATGNAVVLKPAETTPYSTVLLAELAAAVLPAGVFNVVFGSGAVAGDALARHPQIAAVSFTGSINTGRKVGIAAADGVKKSILELGGNSPVIVFEDADLETALDAIAAGGVYNSGQECMSASRLIIHSSIFDRAVEGLKARLSEYQVGDVLDPATAIGPMNSAEQRSRVEAKIAALGPEAKVVLGGVSPEGDGFFFPPTIITGAGQHDEIVQEEIFGPVFTVQTFDAESEAVTMANGTRYGLAASVFTSNVGRATRVQNALNFGTVWVNNHLVFAADLPVSGFGQSGVGTENAELGLLEYTRLKHIMIDQR